MDSPQNARPFVSTNAAMAFITRISQTTAEFAQRAQRTSQLPVVPQYRLDIQAQAEAASNSVHPTPYAPYIRFRPRHFGPQNMSDLPPPSSHSAQVPSGEETNNSMDDAPPSALHSTEGSPPSSSLPSLPGVDASDTNDSQYTNAVSRPSSRGRIRDRDNSCAPRTRNIRSLSPREHRLSSSSTLLTLHSPFPTPSHTERCSLVMPGTLPPGSTNEDVIHSPAPISQFHQPPSSPNVPEPDSSRMNEESSHGHPNQVEQVPRGTCVEPSTTSIVPYYAIPDSCRGGSAMDENPTSPHIPLPVSPISGDVMMVEGSTSPPVLPSVIPARLASQLVTLGIPLENVQMNEESTSPHLNDVAMDHSTSFTTVTGSPLRSSSSNPHSPTTSPPSNPPILSRPVSLPPVPTALADIIGKAVADHLCLGLVEPTVRGVIEACVPRLAEIMESRFATQNPLPSTEGGSCPKSKNRSAESDCRGSDGDDEEEEAVPPPRRKKPGPRGKTNRLHNAFRSYLRSKNIIPAELKAELPVSAPVNAIQVFNQNGEGPPVLENIALDWASHPLSVSCWNREAIAILSLDFHMKLKSGAYKEVVYQEESMNLPALRRLCGQKLVRTHQAHRKRALINAATPDEQEQVKSSLRALEEKRLKGERKISRRFGTVARRKRIVTENCFRDPETWDTITKIIAMLDVEGMSGDETDSPPTWKPKGLRRLELTWLSPSISLLFRSVESYEPAVRIENMREQIGNSSFVRHWEPQSKDTKSGPVRGLPHNWYNDDWFRGLDSGARKMLVARKEVAIPTLKPWA
ncbi:hypothetical protein HD554DRAFT_2270715 [Boletus coccyginus]|nr:hypothetical protein HD554DRAFT_2270715 [Boletus coccyginus]